jgi:hypothetical protein
MVQLVLMGPHGMAHLHGYIVMLGCLSETGQFTEGAPVVPLADVTHAVELIPVYGEKADTNISSAVSLEHYKHFFLNSFADKESYHTFSTEFA